MTHCRILAPGVRTLYDVLNPSGQTHASRTVIVADKYYSPTYLKLATDYLELRITLLTGVNVNNGRKFQYWDEEGYTGTYTELEIY